jgi:hypothetical protein
MMQDAPLNAPKMIVVNMKKKSVIVVKMKPNAVALKKRVNALAVKPPALNPPAFHALKRVWLAVLKPIAVHLTV